MPGIHSQMLNKQAVWIQIVSCSHLVFFLACLLSFQSISLKQDSIWTILFGFSSFLHSVVAEHCAIGQVKLSTILVMYHYFSPFIDILVAIGCYFPINWTNLFLMTILSLCLHQIPHKYSRWFLIFGLLNGITGYSLLISCRLFLQYKRQQFLHACLNQSQASIYLKKSVACKTGDVIVEALLLWSIRCESRFPHKIRYTPILIAAIAIISAAVYCQYTIAETKVSEKSTIILIGDHCLTPSFHAILHCEQCQKCVTNVDIEEVNRESVYKFDKDFNI